MPTDIQRIAVIGAGDAGRAFALRCVAAGFQVLLEDVMPSRLRSARQQAEALQQSSAQNFAQTSALGFASTVEEAVRDADLAIDFVPDELESKLEIFSLLDRMAPPRTVFCTPTEALSIADLASCTYRPGLCFGLRGLRSQAAGASLDLVLPKAASPVAAEAVASWLAALGFAVNQTRDDAEPLLRSTISQNAGSIERG